MATQTTEVTTTASRKRRVVASDERKATFLQALIDGDCVIDAARKAGCDRHTFYARRRTEPDFAAAWDDAYERGTDRLEREAERRAIEGVDDFKVGPGGELVPIRKYSDVLLIFLLKARRPGKFRDNVTVQHTGHDGGPVVVEHREKLTLREGLERVAARRGGVAEPANN